MIFSQTSHPKRMPSKKTLSDSENESGSFGDCENELHKLQRQYRSKESERKTLYLEVQETTRKQKLEIESLEKERNELELTMRSLKSSTHQRRQKKHFEELKSLSSKNDELTKFIEKEKQKQQELDRKIEEESKKLSKVSELRQASKEGIKKNLSNQRRIKKLEDQLQLANTKFCKLLEGNKDLRQEIQSLRTQRQRFDELFERVEREKHNLQSEVTEVIRLSTQAHEERNEAHDKLAQLREKSDKEEQRFDSDMKQLERNIGESRKLLAFVGTVGKDRDEDAEMRRLREKKEALLFEKRKLLQVDDLETFKDSWGRITKVTQEEDVDAVISRFLEVEEENFAMFNFVNNQSSTIEQLQEEINSIKRKITCFEEGSQKSKEQKSSLESIFEQRQKEVVEVTVELEEKSDRMALSLEKIKGRISSIFKLIGSNDGSSKFSFDENMTDKNCLSYLAAIEGGTDRVILGRSFGAETSSNHDEELLPAANQIATFREDGNGVSFDGDDDDHIGFNLPSMRDKQAAFGSAHGFLTMDTTASTLKSFEANDDDDDNDDDLPQVLDNIKNSTIQTVMRGNV